MADRKRLSGSQNRKRKAEKEKGLSKQQDSLMQYLRLQQQDRPTDKFREETEDIQGQAKTSTSEYPTVVVEHVDHQNPDLKVAVEHADYQNLDLKVLVEHVDHQNPDLKELALQSVTNINLNYSDPASWKNCDDRLRQILVEHGPDQVIDFKFPYDDNQRKFSSIHYRRRLINDEYVQRQWLQYSVSKDSVFCFCCKLFSKAFERPSLYNNGANDWKNMSVLLANHEKSTEHMANFQVWKELELRLKKNKTIDEESLRLIMQEEKYWHQVLERLIALVRVLGAQNLALRGTHEKLFTWGNGNFLKFLEYLALFDPVMHEHLRKVRDKETHVHYLGKDIQNEMINLLSAAVQEKILASVRAAKYFSLIIDCTPDVSHTEQMTVIIRFVATTDSNRCEIKEHFLGFVPLTGTTGANMTAKILEKLEEMSLSLTNLRGQGYDNGSNMKGKNNGVQRRILDINPRAFFVPCSAHSLNLVVNDAAQCCFDATSFFILVQGIYVYFSSSPQRWGVLLRHVPTLTLKPLSNTRWESRIDALKPLRYQLGDVHDALIDIYEDTTLTGPSGNLSRAEAQGFAKGISNFRFIVSLVVWHTILFEINLTSKLLQAKEFDLQAATKQLCITKIFLENCRTDTCFEKMLVDARELAEEIDIPSVFESASAPTHLRKKKKQFSYEADDESAVPDAKQKFKVNFYFGILDTAINSVNERFSQMEQMNSIFGFLYNVQELHSKSTKNILELCLNLEKSLTHEDSKDIDASELCSELQAIARRVPKDARPQDVLNYICNFNLLDSMPNLSIALRILLTLPVTVASGERSFSKLKLIKTYLRSTMTQDRLVGLSTLSIEQDIAQAINLNELVSTFSKLKARKMRM